MTQHPLWPVRAIERVTGGFGQLGAWLILALIASMVYEVVLRYVFGAPTSWAYEIGYMLLGAIFTLTIGLAQIHRSHVRVDFLYDRMSPRLRATVDLVGYVVFILPLAAWLTWSLGEYAFKAFERGEASGQSAWNPQIWPFRAALTLGFALFTLQTLAEVMKCAYALLHPGTAAKPGPSPSPGM